MSTTAPTAPTTAADPQVVADTCAKLASVADSIGGSALKDPARAVAVLDDAAASAPPDIRPALANLSDALRKVPQATDPEDYKRSLDPAALEALSRSDLEVLVWTRQHCKQNSPATGTTPN